MVDAHGDITTVEFEPEPLRRILADYLLSYGWRQTGPFGRDWSSWRHGCACVSLARACESQLDYERVKHLDRSLG